ncbi:MAG: urease accessory protein UreD [Burkholderiales bacterium]|nr:urease accessory protein UreD [Burkholderiales bacterium]
MLATRAHHGPLRVQRSLYQEGEDVRHTIVIHPPGGIVAGGRLAIGITAAPGAHALLTTPGATKWYRSIGADASQQVKLVVEGNAVLEWMPLESIVFDGARVDQQLRVDLADGARYVGWEIT